MLLEWIEARLTPCLLEARKFGLLREAVAIEARFKRCKLAWQPHLEQTKQTICEAVEATNAPHVMILGAGGLHDIPLDYLLTHCERITLVDIVFLRHVRRLARRNAHIQLLEADITGALSHSEAIMSGAGMPESPLPELWQQAGRPDLVISANLCSQLPLPLVSRLRHKRLPEARIIATAQAIIRAHIEALQSLPSAVWLIADTEWLTTDLSGQPLQRRDALWGMSLPAAPLKTWQWHIAPAPEQHKDRHICHEVAVIRLK